MQVSVWMLRDRVGNNYASFTSFFMKVLWTISFVLAL